MPDPSMMDYEPARPETATTPLRWAEWFVPDGVSFREVLATSCPASVAITGRAEIVHDHARDEACSDQCATVYPDGMIV